MPATYGNDNENKITFNKIPQEVHLCVEKFSAFIETYRNVFKKIDFYRLCSLHKLLYSGNAF